MKRICIVICCGGVLLLSPISAEADLWHHIYTSVIVSDDEAVYLGGLFSKVDIFYEGSPGPDETIFYDISVFAPFTSYLTDNMSYLTVFPDAPIPYSEREEPLPIVTFSTDLDWGELYGPTPFTFTEFGAPEYQVSGTIYNVPLPSTIWLLSSGLVLFRRRKGKTD